MGRRIKISFSSNIIIVILLIFLVNLEISIFADTSESNFFNLKVTRAWDKYVRDSDSSFAIKDFYEIAEKYGFKGDSLQDPSLSTSLVKSYEGIYFIERFNGNFDKAFESIINAAIIASDQPEGVVYTLLASSLKDELTKRKLYIEALNRIILNSKPETSLYDIANYCAGDEYLRIGKLKEAKDCFSKLNFITNWQIIGPFQNEGDSGWKEVYEPEKTIDLSKSYEGDKREVFWHKIGVEPNDGYLDINTLLFSQKEAISYCFTNLYASQDTEIAIKTASSGAIKVWFDNKIITDKDVKRKMQASCWGRAIDQDTSPEIVIKQGWHKIIVKIAKGESDWGFSLRIVTKDTVTILDVGDAYMRPLQIDSSSIQNSYAESEITDKNTFRRDLIKTFEEKSADNSFFNKFHLGIIYNYFNPYHKLEEKDSKVFEELAEKNPQSTLLKTLYAFTVNDSNKKRQNLNNAFELDNNNIEALHNLAYEKKRQQQLETALDLTNKILTINPDYYYAKYLLSEIYLSKGWNIKSFEILKQFVKDYPDNLSAKTFLALSFSEWLSINEKIKLLEDSLRLDYLDPTAVKTLGDIYKERGDYEKLEQLYLKDIEFYPYDYQLLQEIAETYKDKPDTLDKDTMLCVSTKFVEMALKISPENPDLLKLKGEILHKSGQDEEAFKAWQLSLKVKQNQPDLKEYITYLSPKEESYFEPYRLKFDELVAEYKKRVEQKLIDEEGSNVVNLADTLVTKVNKDGTTLNTYYVVKKAVTEQGVKSIGSDSVGFVEGQQEVILKKARTHKPDGSIMDSSDITESSWFKMAGVYTRLYEDYIIKYVGFKGVTSGSLTEVEYEVNDKGKNIYADYYGELFFFGDYSPTMLSKFILITPKDRNYYYKVFRTDTNPEIIETETERIYIWQKENIPKTEEETMMPGASEILPYLKVSTFKTWDEIGKWYWGLIKEQFIITNDLKKTVEDLTKDKATNLDKIKAIYNFVVSDVRYLGLEFGIYGLKPHPANDVLKLRYGDCKDKATLIITMLKEIGIPSEIVLIRTRDLGQIDFEIPTLGLFNHAIAYIPDVDGKPMFLDGTAEFNSYEELPDMDQDVKVFTVQDNKGTFRDISLDSPDKNFSSSSTTITLDTNGKASGKRLLDYSGNYAPTIRYTYQNKATAKDTIERWINYYYPGSKIMNINMPEFKDLNVKTAFDYEFEIPKIASVAKDTMRLKPIFMPNRFTQTYAKLAERKHDLILDYPKKILQRITYNLPDGIRLSNVPENADIKTQFGEFKIIYTKSEKSLKIDEEVRIDVVRVNKDDYPNFRKFLNEIDNKEEADIVLEIITNTK